MRRNLSPAFNSLPQTAWMSVVWGYNGLLLLWRKRRRVLWEHRTTNPQVLLYSTSFLSADLRFPSGQDDVEQTSECACLCATWWDPDALRLSGGWFMLSVKTCQEVDKNWITKLTIYRGVYFCNFTKLSFNMMKRLYNSTERVWRLIQRLKSQVIIIIQMCWQSIHCSLDLWPPSHLSSI